MADKKLLVNHDFNGNQAKNMLLHKNSGDPSSVADAEVWYDTATNQFMARRNGVSEIIQLYDDLEGINYAAARGYLGN